MAFFKETAQNLWTPDQKKSDAMLIWQSTFNKLSDVLGQTITTENGPTHKALAFNCLLVMEKISGDHGMTVAFKNKIKLESTNNFNWLSEIISDRNNHNCNPHEGFGLWRENLAALALSGDENAKSNNLILEDNLKRYCAK